MTNIKNLMLADDFLLFIDANKYLDFYRMDKGKKLLTLLEEQAAYIFVTQQVVNEVRRNKILVAAEFLGHKSKALKLQTFNVPDHLSSTSTGQENEIRQQMREISQKTEAVNKEVDALTLDIMNQISCSEDEVSKLLGTIFTKARTYSPEELERARNRRELGNPPGKSNQPIGDQLTWEQILTHFRGKKRLWIISRDVDYGTFYGGQGFLNGFLYEELSNIVSDPEVYLFKELLEGIKHFVNATGVNTKNRLTPAETEEIEKEEKSLPYLPQVELKVYPATIDLVKQSRMITDAVNIVNTVNTKVLADAMNTVNNVSIKMLADVMQNLRENASVDAAKTVKLIAELRKSSGLGEL